MPDPVLLDPRLFTVFSFLNHQGFDDEHREEGMHPLRMAVRKDLHNIPEDLSRQIQQFSQQHPDADWFAYTQYALMVDNPPAFILKPAYKDTWAASLLPAFDGFLQSFYQRAHLDALWEKYLPQYEQEAALFRPDVYKSYDRLWQYLRIPPAQQQAQVLVVPNLLNAFYRATVFHNPVTDMLYVICGPYSDQSPVDATVVHEVLHTVTGPLLQESEDKICSKQALLSLVETLPTVKDNYGGSFKQILDESLIRALTKRISLSSYETGIEAYIQQEYDEGFILIWYFYEKLVNEFEKSDLSFPDYFPELIGEIDMEHEQSRWAQSNQ